MWIGSNRISSNSSASSILGQYFTFSFQYIFLRLCTIFYVPSPMLDSNWKFRFEVNSIFTVGITSMQSKEMKIFFNQFHCCICIVGKKDSKLFKIAFSQKSFKLIRTSEVNLIRTVDVFGTEGSVIGSARIESIL